MEIREGYMPFMGYQTYYRMVGTQTGNKKPLILLHGGPGSTHNYFEVLDRLAEEDGRQLVMYDQIGCGESYVEAGSVECRSLDTGTGRIEKPFGPFPGTSAGTILGWDASAGVSMQS